MLSIYLIELRMVIQMRIIVRKAVLSDAEFIAMAYRSDNPYVEQFLQKGLDTPENLCRFGGVWMHRDSCAEHIGLFRQYGGEVFVAELNHKVVGHIEVTVDANRSIGEYAYINVLMVHRDYRGRGVGRKLVEAAIDYAREREQNRILVAAEEQSVGFYKKLGFRIMEEWLSVYVPKRQSKVIATAIEKEEALSEIMRNRYDPILGKFHGTRTILFEFVTRYATLRKLDIHHIFLKTQIDSLPAIIGIRTSKDIPNVAWVWSEHRANIDKTIEQVAGIIYHLNIPKILTAIPKQNTNLEIIEKVTWMEKTI